eukprot:Gb_36394 [translate_table: standard]
MQPPPNEYLSWKLLLMPGNFSYLPISSNQSVIQVIKHRHGEFAHLNPAMNSTNAAQSTENNDHSFVTNIERNLRLHVKKGQEFPLLLTSCGSLIKEPTKSSQFCILVAKCIGLRLPAPITFGVNVKLFLKEVPPFPKGT